MGIYDREYYRDDKPARFELGGNWSATAWLIGINAAVFLLNVAVGHDHLLTYSLSATPDTIAKPYLWWKLITYGFAHDPDGISHIFWNMIALWMFGRPVEGVYGSKEFLRFYLVSVVLGGIFWAARSFALGTPGANGALLLGASGAVTAVTLLFCIHYPRQIILLMMVLPVPAWFLGAMIIVVNVFGSLTESRGVAFDVHLVGAVFAICYYRFQWNVGRWAAFLPSPAGLFRSRPQLRVHKPVETRDEEDLAAESDRLLDKINREGIDSLTARERKTLEQHSRRMRDRRP